MLWDNSEYAGFSTTKPWMKLHQDRATLNVAAEEKDPDSVLNYYKTLIKLRRSPEYKETFTYGTFVPLANPNDHTLAYQRQYHDKTILVVANFGYNGVEFPINKNSKVLLSSGEVSTNADKVYVTEGSSVIILL